jgi:hypothetical protein
VKGHEQPASEGLATTGSLDGPFPSASRARGGQLISLVDKFS